MYKTVTRTLAVVAALAITSTSAEAQLFYNGQFDGTNGLLSIRNGAVADIRVYENFTVGATPWTVNALFGEFLADASWSSAYWEIRSGVSAGDGGALLLSGTNSATRIATGRSGFGYTEYRATVSGFTPFALGSGEYWMTIAPIAGGSGYAFVSTTSGAGAVNATLDRTNNYLDGAGSYDFRADYTPGTDYAFGAEGAMTTTPEPATFILVGAGIAGLAVARRRRKTA